MFGGKKSIPITIRLILGRGWGQGPQHSQNLQAWFAHIPGLKVVMPATAYDAKGLLLSAIFDNNPVIYLEHRWLRNLECEVPDGDYRVPIGKAFEVPMSGGLYLTQDNPELSLVYEVGKEILTYKNGKDCAEKTKWLLANPEEAAKIREAGRKRALKDHTWEKRFEKIFRLAGIME